LFHSYHWNYYDYYCFCYCYYIHIHIIITIISINLIINSIIIMTELNEIPWGILNSNPQKRLTLHCHSVDLTCKFAKKRIVKKKLFEMQRPT